MYLRNFKALSKRLWCVSAVEYQPMWHLSANPDAAASLQASATTNQLSHQINSKQNQCQGQLHDSKQKHIQPIQTHTNTHAHLSLITCKPLLKNP